MKIEVIMEHPAELFRKRRANYFSIMNKHGFSKALYVLEKDYGNQLFDKQIYSGLLGELIFLKEGADEYKLTPTLDCGDHCDFVGSANNNIVRFDVTTSLEYKTLDDYEKFQKSGHFYQIALVDIHNKKIERIIDINIPFCKVCGGRLITTLVQKFSQTRQGMPTQSQTIIKMCSNNMEHNIESNSFDYYLPSMSDEIDYLNDMYDDDNDEILEIYKKIPIEHGINNSLFFSKLIEDKIHACGVSKYIVTDRDGDGYWGNKIYWTTDLVESYIQKEDLI